MKPVDVRGLRLQVQLGLMRLGWLRALALLSLLAGVAALAWVMQRLPALAQVDLAALQQARAELASLRVAAGVRRPELALPQGQGALEAVLGEGEQVERYLARVFAAAQAFEISLQSGDYEWQAGQGGAPDLYRIRLPAKGSYAALRGFYERVLGELPFASLDELQLKREDIGDELLAAQLQFSLHLHPGSAVQAAGARP